MSIGDAFEGLPQILALGNREGMLALANVLLWLIVQPHAQAWETRARARSLLHLSPGRGGIV